MADVINKARLRLAEFRREVERLELFIRTYEELEGVAPPTTVAPANKLMEAAGGALAQYSRYVGGSIADAAVSIIQEQNRPMGTHDLIAALEQRGIAIGGADKMRNASSIFSREKRLTSLRGIGWWLTDAPPPTANQSEADATNDIFG